MARLSQWLARWGLPLSLSLLALVSLLSLLPMPEMANTGNDKGGHLLAYALIVFPAIYAGIPKWFLYSFAVTLWSGAIELIQPMVGREAEWLDLAANFAGVAIGVVLAFCTRHLVASMQSDD